jgi:hypothetical protein
MVLQSLLKQSKVATGACHTFALQEMWILGYYQDWTWLYQYRFFFFTKLQAEHTGWCSERLNLIGFHTFELVLHGWRQYFLGRSFLMWTYQCQKNWNKSLDYFMKRELSHFFESIESYILEVRFIYGKATYRFRKQSHLALPGSCLWFTNRKTLVKWLLI